MEKAYYKVFPSQLCSLEVWEPLHWTLNPQATGIRTHFVSPVSDSAWPKVGALTNVFYSNLLISSDHSKLILKGIWLLEISPSIYVCEFGFIIQ